MTTFGREAAGASPGRQAETRMVRWRIMLRMTIRCV
jgi:hypothetical protein